MKNIFDFATKELSQDAFIMWLISNNDEREDVELRNTSLSFISFLTDYKLGTDELSNSRIEVFSQVNHTDISIDIYRYGDNKKHDIIVIEDKTGSSEHNQLIDYNKAITKWKNKGDVFKAFYKIGKITDKDKEGIEKANKDSKDSQWRLFDLDKIWDFFKDKNKSSSQVLNDYISYIGHIYDALHCKTNDELVNWKSYHWEGFVNTVLSDYNNENSDKEEYVWVISYQGRYNSICYQRCLPGSKDAAVIEIFIRSQNHFSATFHHAFYEGENEPRKWSVDKCKDENKEAKLQIRNKLIEHVKNISKTAEFKDIHTARSNASNTFGRISTGYKEINTFEEAKETILYWILLFNKVIESYR